MRGQVKDCSVRRDWAYLRSMESSDATGSAGLVILRPADSQPPFSKPREEWVDNLRTFIILLVVNMHACVTYSHVGGWYIKLPPEPDLQTKLPFILWQGHLQSFFMGLLFFFAGHFSEKSIAKKGRLEFLRDRGVRLGLPTLFFMLCLSRLTVWGIMRLPPIQSFPQFLQLYREYLFSGRFVSSNGPLWFAFALLIFSAVFALLRSTTVRKSAGSFQPGVVHILGFGLSAVCLTFVVRLVNPIETDLLNLQLCFFTQYILAFWAGILSARHQWLATLARSKLARNFGFIALIGGPALLAAVVYFGGPPTAHAAPYAGGWNWQAAGLAFWEQMTGPALSLGLMYWFSRRLNFANTITRWLSARSFAVYVFHTPVLVTLAQWFEPLHLTPFPGSCLLTLVGLLASYAVADLVLRIPGFNRML